MTAKPRYSLDVPSSLWVVVAEATSPEFADSYLFGAELNGTMLEPRTLTGYRMMRDRGDFMSLLSKLGLTLKQPAPWSRGCGKRSSDEVFQGEFYGGKPHRGRNREDR